MLTNVAWLLSSGFSEMGNPYCNPAFVDYAFAGAAVCALLGLGGIILATRRGT